MTRTQPPYRSTVPGSLTPAPDAGVTSLSDGHESRFVQWPSQGSDMPWARGLGDQN